MARTIVITGAGDGLGRALARRFATDGDTVVLLGRTLAKVEAVAAELSGTHYAIHCDVADPASVRTAFAEIADRVPRIDVLINNAAIYAPFTLAEATDEQIAGMLSINLAGPIYCARSALPLFGGKGHIINVTSESLALKMPMLWMYAGTKIGLELVSEMWSRELAPEGIRTTVVRAGMMMDETKTSSGFPMDVAMRFGAANAAVGINLRERPISHYNSVAEAFHAVVNAPSDLHMDLVTLSGSRRTGRTESTAA